MSVQTPEQRVVPVLHSQRDERQVSADVHVLPHAPQFVSLAERSTSHPLVAFSSQLP